MSEKLVITCPACGLLCDDIVIDADTRQPTNTSCAKSIQFFSQATSASASCTVAGKQTDLTHAVKTAALLLKNSQQPLISGLGTEVTGMRSVIRLAEKIGASLDHMHSESMMRNFLALQSSGWQTTTLMEIKHRADVILAIGTDIVSSHPRFFERFVWNTNNLFNKAKPNLIFLGASAKNATENLLQATSPLGTAPTFIPTEIEHLPEILNVLNALSHQKNCAVTHIGSTTLETLKALIHTLNNAKYAVIVWSASSLDYPHAALTIESITQLINKLSESTRVVGLPLSAGDGDSSVANTNTWLTGYPTRTRYSDGKVIYDSHLNATKQQLHTCDSLVWISSFNPITPPDNTAPTIVLGHPSTPFSHQPEVFIPIGAPGIDHEGIMFRMDSSISLPLKKIHERALPSLSQIVQQILGHMS